ncbi:hypothetical protein [Variovorax sp. DXTD-1]|uniref:hypothetical protein n=1 Tax=Variovorax sp. DXTD-1 TaxID=2495592 RepID=UPI000F898B76|nr:hypothetical protein [Variovorax sp. DXTD-1]RST47117.1 hypothetical protein EJI00_19605 [Variovorax sp. DXTD-1]
MKGLAGGRLYAPVNVFRNVPFPLPYTRLYLHAAHVAMHTSTANVMTVKEVADQRRVNERTVFRVSVFKDDVFNFGIVAILEQNGVANVRSL